MPRLWTAKKVQKTIRKNRRKYKKKINLSKRVTALESSDRQMYNFTNVNTVFTTSGIVIDPIPNLTQGDGVGQRQGNRITLKSFSITLCFTINAATASTYNAYMNAVRMTVFTWKKPQGASFTRGYLLNDVSSNWRATFSKYNINNINNFKVYYDKIVHRTCSDGGTSTAIGNGVPTYVKYAIKIPSKYATVTYTGNTGMDADVSENTFMIMLQPMFVSGDTGPTGGAVTATDWSLVSYSYNATLRFIG